MRLKKPTFRARVAAASGCSGGSSSTVMPAARRRSMPRPLTSGLGSRNATSTRASPTSMSASQHGGVRPWWLQGSSVTTALPPRRSAPAAAAARKATISACGPPARWVWPSKARPSGAMMRQATRGLGSDSPIAWAAKVSSPASQRGSKALWGAVMGAASAAHKHQIPHAVAQAQTALLELGQGAIVGFGGVAALA